MSEEKKNPLVAGLLGLVPGVINTVVSLVKDKKKKADGETIANMVNENISEGVALSSKRVMNLVGTGVIVTLAVSLITANGPTKANLALLAIGVAYSLGMSLITYLSEKK